MSKPKRARGGQRRSDSPMKIINIKMTEEEFGDLTKLCEEGRFKSPMSIVIRSLIVEAAANRKTRK